MYVCVYSSLSLSIYIYIYTHMSDDITLYGAPDPDARERPIKSIKHRRIYSDNNRRDF